MATANPLPPAALQTAPELQPHVLARVLAKPLHRPEALARGRAVVITANYHREHEVAARLVDCLVRNHLP